MIKRAAVLLACSLTACATDSLPSPQTAADRMRIGSMTTSVPLDGPDPDALAHIVRSDFASGVRATYRLIAPVELATAARAQIERVAAAGFAPVTLIVMSGARLHVEVTRLGAHVPACPDWSRGSEDDFTNRPSSNFGCADAVNLAAQVASPGDLIAGRGRSTTAGAPLGAAVARYAADRAKPLDAVDRPAQGGAVKDDPRP